MPDQHEGKVEIVDSTGDVRIRLHATHRYIQILDRSGERIIHLGPNADLRLGGSDKNGDIYLYGTGADTSSNSEAVIQLSAGYPRVRLRNKDDHEITFSVDGRHGNVYVGGPQHNGSISVLPATAAGRSTNEATILIDGEHGDIKLRNADAAEQFDLAKGASAVPGSVMVMNNQGELQACEKTYDHRVVGVVSGAGNYRPALVLDNNGDLNTRACISIMGKVACKADATAHPISVGDLLTTSDRSGHCMGASDFPRAHGAIVGKAITPLTKGVGLVTALIMLR